MPGDQFITGLDLGSYYIKASSITGKNGDVVFSAYGLSEGIQDNKITDSIRFTNSVRSVLRQLEIKSGSPIDKIFLSIDGNYVRTEFKRGSAPIVSGTVTNQDTYKALMNSMLIAKENDEEIVDLIVSEYKVDGVSFNNVKGVEGDLLEVSSQVVLSDKNFLNQVNSSLQRDNVTLTGTNLSVHGMANMLLKKKQRTDGVLMIDAGHTKTELFVYKDNKVVFQDIVPLGGKNITKDLSIVLKISMDDAEQLKVQFGKGNLDPNFPKYKLIEDVITARTNEILKFVRILFVKYREHLNINEAYVYGGGLCGFRNIGEICKDALNISTNFITSDIIKSDDVFTLNSTGCAFNIIHQIQSDLIVKRIYDTYKVPEKSRGFLKDEYISRKSEEELSPRAKSLIKDPVREITEEERKAYLEKLERKEEEKKSREKQKPLETPEVKNAEEKQASDDYFSIFDKVKRNAEKTRENLNIESKDRYSSLRGSYDKKDESYYSKGYENDFTSSLNKDEYLVSDEESSMEEKDNNDNGIINKFKKLFGIK